MHQNVHGLRLLFKTSLVGLIVVLICSTSSSAIRAVEAVQPEQYRAVNFQVNYRTAADPGSCDPGAGALQAWPADGQVAMNHVVDILDDLINSAVVIAIDACYQTDPDPDSGTLASAGPNGFLTQADVAQLPLAGRDYPVALANALAEADQNGGDVEITASANTTVDWDFCTVGCVVDANQFDFVSTMVHEVLHGLGFFTSFDPSRDDAALGTYTEPPAIMDEYIVRVSDGVKLIDLPNNSAQLMAAFTQGSGSIAFNGPNTVAINGNSTPFIYTPITYEQGSSMSHWDDAHPTSAGRMMNAATDAGPSSRVVHAITLMALKDIGWSVNEASDYGESALAAYGTARHINAPGFVNYMRLGATFSAEAAPATIDTSDDGVTRPTNWVIGSNGGSVSISVQGSSATAAGCLSGWIDWARNGNFTDASEVVINMRPVTPGAQSYTFEIPASITGNAADTLYNARFRLMPDWDNDGSCADQVALSPSVGVLGGEAEDYPWALDGGTTTIPSGNISIFLPITLQ